MPMSLDLLEEMYLKQKYLMPLDQLMKSTMSQFMILTELSSIFLNLKLKGKIKFQLAQEHMVMLNKTDWILSRMNY